MKNKNRSNVVARDNATGEEILNSLTVISGIAQLLLKDKYPAEFLMLSSEIEKINTLVRNYFKIQLRER